MIKVTVKDGTGVTGRFLDADTGADLSKVLAIQYGATITLDHMVTMQANLCMVSGEVVVGKTEWRTKHPVTGNYEPLAALVFRDGIRIDFDDAGMPVVGSERGFS